MKGMENNRRKSMLLLIDHELISAYKKAIEMNLEEDFLKLLARELERRNIVCFPERREPKSEAK